MEPNRYDKRVFINCPFDAQYKPLLEAIVFAACHCGLRVRCALEIDDASEVRIDKVFHIIAENANIGLPVWPVDKNTLAF